MNTTIYFYVKQVYGNQMSYIADKKISDAVQLLTGQKTLTDSNMRALASLGFVFEEILQSKIAQYV